MGPMSDPSLDLSLEQAELDQVDKFRKGRNTSVLTIMFTDIQGFTHLTEERGDSFSNGVRREHDSLLVPIIEREGAGRVIKHIGDAVMAVFSEPSTAVARALEIQETLRTRDAARPDLPPLRVRIGLHMGQVTVEDKVAMDVFGRHVNRASRVEGLAEGGQVFLTYGVLDSAKGWLSGRPEAAWVSHGKYRVKGIDEPLEIFEAYRPGTIKPRGPKGAKRQGGLPRLAPAIGLVAAGALAVLGVLSYQRTTVTFEDLYVRNDTAVVLDHKTRLQVEGTHEDHLRKCLTKIAPGEHLLAYDVSYVTRYYSPLTVKRGKNILKPRFEYFGLPGLTGNTGYDPKRGKGETFTRTFEYATYDDAGVKRDHKADIVLTLKADRVAPAGVKKGPKGPPVLLWTLDWTLTLDGKELSKDRLTLTHDSASPEATSDKKALWEDARHRYVLSYRLSNSYCQGEVQAEYSEYR